MPTDVFDWWDEDNPTSRAGPFLAQITAGGVDVQIEIPRKRKKLEFTDVFEWWNSPEYPETYEKLPKIIPIRNPDGTQSSENTRGVSHQSLNAGRETLIPTIIEGRRYSVEEATRLAIASGLRYPSFESIEKAETYAALRSKLGGATTQGFLGRPDAVKSAKNQTDDELREQILQASGTDWYTWPGEVIAGLSRGAANTTIASLTGTVQLAAEAANLVGIDNDVVEWARGIQSAAQSGVESGLPVTPGFEESNIRKLSEAGGSIIPAIAGGVAGGLPGIAAFGTTVQYSNTYNQARELGATKADARFYARISGAVGGVTEPAGAILPAIKLWRRVGKVSGGTFIREMLKGSARESIQEVLQEIPDETVRQTYIEERDAMDAIAALAEVGLIGGTIGALLPGVVITVKAGRTGLEFISRKFEKPISDSVILPDLRPAERRIDVPPAEPEVLTEATEPGVSVPVANVPTGELVTTDSAIDRILADHAKRVEAGQKDPVPNQALFTELGFPEMTRKQRAEYIERLKGERLKVEDRAEGLIEDLKVEEEVRGQTDEEIMANLEEGDVIESLGHTWTIGKQDGKLFLTRMTEDSSIPADFGEPKGRTPEEIGATLRVIRNATTINGVKVSHEPSLEPSLEQEKSDAERTTQAVREPEGGRDVEGEGRRDNELEGPVGAPAEKAAPPEAVAVPTEERPPTSIKNEVVDRERKKRGLPPMMERVRRADPVVWDEAMREIEADPGRQDALIAELADKPRPTSPTETLQLLHRQVTLQNEYDNVLGRLDIAQKAGNDADIAKYQSQEELLLAELEQLYTVNENVGSVAGSAFRFRQALAQEEFSVVRMLAMKRKAKAVDQLSTEDEVVVRTANRKIADLEQRLLEHTQRITELEAKQESIRATQGIAAAETKRRRVGKTARARAEVDQAWKDFEGRISGKLFANPLDPELVASAAKLARAYIRLGVSSFQDFLAAVKKKIGADKADKLGDTFERAWNTAIADETPQPRKALESSEQVSRFARRLAEFFVSTGIVERNALVDAVHGELVKTLPELTRRQAMDAISGYGQYSQLSKDELSVLLRDLKGQMQQIAKLEDMQAGQAPLKTGQERRAPSDTERQLIQQVNELKKQGGFDVTDPATQLKSALGAIKTRLRNQIADLEEQIASREKIIKTRTEVVRDEETRQLERKRDALKEQFDEIFGKRELTDEQRIKNATAAVKRSIAEYERRIAEKDVAPKRRISKTPIMPELQALRDRRDALKEEFEHLKDLVNPKMTPEQRALSALKASLRRRTADYRERLAREDFAPRKRKETKLDKEAESLRFELEQAKADFLKALAADTRARRTLFQKAIGLIPEAANTFRSIITSMELSAAYRQGAFVLHGRPSLSPKMFKRMIAAAKSKAEASRLADELEQRPNMALYKRSGLGLTDPGGKLGRQEEEYMATWSKKIPGVAASERAYVTGLNYLRADYFDILIETLGKGGTVTEEEGKILAAAVNDFTGRASLGKYEAAAVPLATVFFAPKFRLSRFNTLLLHPLWKGTARTRILLAKEYARSLAGVGAFYSLIAMGLYALVGPPGEDKEWDIEVNPFSSDFGKIRIREVRIDPLAGLAQVTVFLARFLGGKTKQLSTGKVVPIRGEEIPFGGLTTAKVTANFLRNSLSPAFGTTLNIFAGKNVLGEKVTPVTTSRDLLIPIAYRDILNYMKELGVPAGVGVTLLEFVGISGQYHDPDTFGIATRPAKIHRMSSKIGKDDSAEDRRRLVAIFVRKTGMTQQEALAALRDKYKLKRIRRNGKLTAYGEARRRLISYWPKDKP